MIYVIKYFNDENQEILGNAKTPQRIVRDLKTINGVEKRISSQLSRFKESNIKYYNIYICSNFHDENDYRLQRTIINYNI